MKAGNSLGRAGEWAHYVGASILCFEVGGAPLTVAYFALQTVPVLVMWGRGGSRGDSRLWLLAPGAIGAVALMVQLSNPQGFWIVALGAAAIGAGLGGAFTGRFPAWMAGFREGPGAAGSIGALIAIVIAGRWGLPSALAFAATVLISAGLLGEEHEHRGAVVPPLAPAAAAMGWIAGMQVIQFAFVGNPAAAGFFVLAYSIGVTFGFRAAPTADLRAILAAPFAAAAAVGALTVIEGPGLLLLWGAVAAAVGLVLGSGPSQAHTGASVGDITPARDHIPLHRDWIPAAAAAGAIWSLSAGTLGTEPVLWGAAATALAGGFLSMYLARRHVTRPAVSFASKPAPVLKPIPSPAPVSITAPVLAEAPASVRVPIPVSVPIPPAPSTTLVAAAQVLLDASRTAREIRTRALQLHKEVHGTDCVQVARTQAVQVLDRLQIHLLQR